VAHARERGEFDGVLSKAQGEMVRTVTEHSADLDVTDLGDLLQRRIVAEWNSRKPADLEQESSNLDGVDIEIREWRAVCECGEEK
jgi:hypothetical protein